MKYKLTHNMGLKLLSVLAACLIWLVVMDNNDPVNTQSYKNVPITIRNEDTITKANKTYTVVDDTDKVNVYVTARRSVRSRLNASSFTIKADLENYNEALGSVPLEFSCSDASVQPENMRIVPSSLKIKMEDKIEQSFAPVVTTDKAAKGYELGRTTLLGGDTIKIAGAQSLINIIGKVTVPVEISGFTESTQKQYAIRIEDKNGTVFNEGQMAGLEIKGSDGILLQDNMVDVGIEIWKIYENIPIEVQMDGEPAAGYRVTGITMTPETVNLAASEEAIERLGGSLVLNEKISVEGLRANQEYTFDVNDTLNGLSDIRLQAETASVVTVNIQVEEIGSKTLDFPLSELELQNVPQGKKLIFSPTDKLQVNVRSTEEKLQDLSIDDIVATLDLAACTENGNYTLPVAVTLPDNYELGAEVTIVVNVSDAESETEAEAEALTEE